MNKQINLLHLAPKIGIPGGGKGSDLQLGSLPRQKHDRFASFPLAVPIPRYEEANRLRRLRGWTLSFHTLILIGHHIVRGGWTIVWKSKWEISCSRIFNIKNPK